MSFDICGLVFHDVLSGALSPAVLLSSSCSSLCVIDTVHTRFTASYILSSFSCGKGFKCLPTAHFHSVLSPLSLCRSGAMSSMCVFTCAVSREGFHFRSLVWNFVIDY